VCLFGLKDSLLFSSRCCIKLTRDKDLSSVTELFSDANDAFFERMTNSEHVLQPFLPEKENVLAIDH